MVWFDGFTLTRMEVLGLGISEVNVHFHKAQKFSYFSDRKHACNFCFKKISDEVVNDFRSLEVDKKIKLYEFKFL